MFHSATSNQMLLAARLHCHGLPTCGLTAAQKPRCVLPLLLPSASAASAGNELEVLQNVSLFVNGYRLCSVGPVGTAAGSLPGMRGMHSLQQ